MIPVAAQRAQTRRRRMWSEITAPEGIHNWGGVM